MPLGAARRAGAPASRASASAPAAAASGSKAASLLPSPQLRNVRRGVIRSLVIVVDLSAAAAAPDMRPTRAAAAASAVGSLVRAFFDANQLSSVSLVVTRHGRAERLTELSGAPEAHLSKLAASLECGGSASLQNALDVAVSTLSSVPPYSLRECLVFFCGLATCDPGDVFASVQAAKRARVRVSVIGLAAEVFACSKAAATTKGRHAVALDAAHVAELALSHAPAPAITGAEATPSLVRMGFARDLGGRGGSGGGGEGPPGVRRRLGGAVAGGARVPALPRPRRRAALELPRVQPHARVEPAPGAVVPPSVPRGGVCRARRRRGGEREGALVLRLPGAALGLLQAGGRRRKQHRRRRRRCCLPVPCLLRALLPPVRLAHPRDDARVSRVRGRGGRGGERVRSF